MTQQNTESSPAAAQLNVGTVLPAAHMKKAKAELKAWRRAYREALELWKTDKDTVFPEGSYWVVVHHGAAVAA